MSKTILPQGLSSWLYTGIYIGSLRWFFWCGRSEYLFANELNDDKIIGRISIATVFWAIDWVFIRWFASRNA